MAYCRLYKPSDGSNARICRKCNRCVISDEPSATESEKSNQVESCMLYQPDVHDSNAKICVKCKKCVVKEYSDTSVGTQEPTFGACPRHCVISTCQRDRDADAPVYKKCKGCKCKESQTDVDKSAEAQTIVIQIAKHPKDIETKTSDKSTNRTGSVSQQKSKNNVGVGITQEPIDEQVHDRSTSYTALPKEKQPSEIISPSPAPSETSSKRPDEPPKKSKFGFLSKRKLPAEKPVKENNNGSLISFHSGDASSAPATATEIKTVDDAKLLTEIAKIRKMLEKPTECPPNTNTIILPSGSKLGDESGDLKRLQDAFRDGAFNSRKDLQDVLNEVQKQKQEIATLKQLLTAFLNDYDDKSKPATRSPSVKIQQLEENQKEFKSRNEKSLESDEENDKALERRALKRGDADYEPKKRKSSVLFISPSGDVSEIDEGEEIRYKKPTAFSDVRVKKKRKWDCCGLLNKRKKKVSTIEDFEKRHDPRRQ